MPLDVTAPLDPTDPELLEAMQLDLELEGFSKGARLRGHEYASLGRVSNLHRAGPVVRAEVRGGARYRVTWRWADEDGWVGSCSCPVPALCKHLYAVALEALADPDVLGMPEPGDDDDRGDELARVLAAGRHGAAPVSRPREERAALRVAHVAAATVLVGIASAFMARSVRASTVETVSCERLARVSSVLRSPCRVARSVGPG